MEKPVLFFTIADEKNMPYASMLEKSFKKFHSDIDFKVVTGEELSVYTKDDPAFFYRATPILAESFLNEYDLVVKMDADSIVCDDLSYIWKTIDYDVAGVLNYNAPDAQAFGFVQAQGVLPIEYVNCGLVAMRSKKFVHDWKVWCFTPQFDRCQYREQDGLNLMIYHGNWNVRILDHGDGPANMHKFWGLFNKSYWTKTILKDNKIIIPKDEKGIPRVDTEIAVIHWAGGQQSAKMNYKTAFPEEVSRYIDTLVS